jgi:RNA polymerase sigma factor (sigma-70 family)
VTTDDSTWLAREAALLRGICRGDKSAFAEVYRHFADPLLHRVLLPRLGDRDLAADALSDTFHAFIEHVDTYQPGDKGLWPWLATIATNKANDIYRRHARGNQSLAQYHALLAPLWEAGGPPRPDELRDQAKLLQAARDVLATLHPRYRTAIELRFFQDLDRDECARRMEVAIGTFDVLLLRSLRAFRATWDERFAKVSS